MKIKVEPGRVLRLTPRKNSSSRGGEYDLDKLGLSEEQQKELLACKGVSAIGSAQKAPAKGGES